MSVDNALNINMLRAYCPSGISAIICASFVDNTPTT